MNARSPVEFKVVVAGPFGVGKTTMISNITSEPMVGTEVATTGDEAEVKASTTVGLEHGTLHVQGDEFDISLMLFGTPGQPRFRFVWDVVSIGADGVVVLVDGTRPETWDDALATLDYFADALGDVCIVGVNRTEPGSSNCERLAHHFGEANVPLVPCDVIDPTSAREVLVALIGQILGDNSETGNTEGGLDERSRIDHSHAAL